MLLLAFFFEFLNYFVLTLHFCVQALNRVLQLPLDYYAVTAGLDLSFSL